jgi:peptidyl-prolyl cis-trans isomerase D
MFDFVQKHKRWLQVFLGLIAITFATWGIESYTRFAGGRDTVASVNGSDITQREFDSQLRAQQEQLQRMFGGRIDPAAFDNPEGRRALLDQMIGERLIATESAKRYLFVDDKRLADFIVSLPAFQENGKFSPEAFERAARSQNPPLSSRQFEERIRQSIPFQQLAGSITETSIVPRAVATRLAAIEAQQREVSESRIAARQFLEKVKLDEAKVKEYYEQHPTEFRTPERVRAEYVVLSADALARQETVSDEELKKAYDDRASAFRVEEQRRASHILVKTKEEADKIVAELKKNPGAFADLAKKQSQDPGSAEKGGDLGWFARGAMVKPFEEAVFSMKQGELRVAQSEFGFHVVRLTGIQPGKVRPLEEVRKELTADLAKKQSQDPGSAEKGGDLGWFARGAMVKPFEEAVFSMKQGELRVAQSEFGFHVVRLTGIQPGKVRPLEEVRKELTADLTRQKAQRKYAESSEAFGNMVYEQSESLKPVAERFKLQIQTTGWVAKGGAGQELGALDNPKLLAALFSQDAIANKRNTDAIEVAPNTLVAARVLEHQPAAQRKFEEVKNDITEMLRRREAMRLAEEQGAAKLEQLKKGENPALTWSAPRLVSRRAAQGLPGDVLRKVVAADTSKLPAYVGTSIPETGYMIVRISKVVDGQAPAADDKQVEARAAGMAGAADYEAYLASLKGRASISINSANLEKK